MATEKLRAELEIITAKAEKDLKRFDRSLAGVEKRIASIGGRGGKSLKPLGEGLSAATVNASEFEKSMAAANARVIAFGASAGLILQVQRALKETVRATIEVEKSLTDINVVLNTNTANLQKFGDSLFKIAGQTGQGFKTVAVAATELARQGLSMEKTLLRTKDALILTRLTGMGAEEAVSSLTAAVNSFSKAGITSAQVINKMAKVDQAFAVSSDDLAKAISRVGSSAVDAGVSMDELLAITTAVQQRTARGGAVIGNAFKTIFTRIGRTDVQKKLAGIGVATRDMQGQMLPATKVLENLSKKFQVLSKVQQNQIAESVAGVFQVNILRAALGDLSSKYGVYNRALKESATATTEAYQKNAILNQTLDAMVNKTLANLTKAGAAIGGATLKPAIENVLSAVNAAIGAFGEGGRFEEFGKGIGKDLLEGVGKFISGPGLAILTIGIGKLAINFASFAKTAVAGVLELNKNVLLRKNLEAQVTAELQRQPNIIKAIERGEMSAATAAKDMLATMKATNLEASKLAATSRSISASMLVLPGGRRPGRAAGFVPNFADPNAERGAAAMGGYRAGAIKTMNIPGQGNVMYNGAETVKQFPGMVQPAIMPPQRSLAGANYKKSFGAAHGFDPYAASGFVPNFAPASAIFAKAMGNISAGKTQGFNTQIEVLRTKGPEGKRYAKQLESELEASMMAKKAGAGGVKVSAKERYFDTAGTIGLLGITGSHSGSSLTGLDQIGIFKERSGLSIEQLKKHKVRFDNMQSRSIDQMNKSVTLQKFSDKVSELLTDPVADLADMIFDGALGNDNAVSIRDLKNKFRGNTQLLPPGAEGSIFEAAVNLGLLTTKTSAAAKRDAFDQSTKGAQKPFDFEEVGPAKPDFKEIFRFDKSLVYADAKRTIDNKSMGTLINKAYNRGIAGLPYMELLTGGAKVAKGSRRRGRALGHVPNFSPLGDAITRERAAGVPKSAIRVGSSPALKGPANPGGLGVYNTIDEPAGLGQGISRSRSMGINPKTHGVPNFADRIKIDMPPGYVMPGVSPVAESRTRIEGKEGPKKINEGGTKIKKAADTMKAATDKLTGAGGLMALSSIGYMAAPALQRLTGMDPRIMDTGMMALGSLGAAQMFLGSDAEGDSKRRGARDSFRRKSRAGARLGGAAGRGAGVMRGLGAAGASILGLPKGKVTTGGALKGLARRAALPVTAYAATAAFFQGLNESEEERNFRLADEALTKAQESDSRPILEQLGAGVDQFSGGFRTSSNKVRRQQFADIRKMVYGEGGVMQSGDTKTSNIVGEAFSEFTDSFTKGSKAVESAGEKFNKTIASVADNLSAEMRKLENRKLITGIQKDFADPELESKPMAEFTEFLSRGKFTRVGSQRDIETRVIPMLKDMGLNEIDIEDLPLAEKKRMAKELGIPEGARTREFFFEGAANTERRGKDLAERIMSMAASPDEIFRNILAAEQQHGGTLEQNLQRIDLFDDPTYGSSRRSALNAIIPFVGSGDKAFRTSHLDPQKLEDMRAAAERFGIELDPNDPKIQALEGATKQGLKAGRFGLAMLGISPKIQDQLNVIDPETLKAAEDELLKMFQKGGRFGPGANKAFRSGSGIQNVKPELVDTSLERRSSALASGAIAAEKLRAAKVISDIKIEEQSQALKRDYQNALKASTMGLYGEADIKLEEARKKAAMQFNIEAENIKSRINLAKEEEKRASSDLVASEIRKSPSLILGLRREADDVGKLGLDAARDDLAVTRGALDNPFVLGPDEKKLLEIREKLVAIRIKRLETEENEGVLNNENLERQREANSNAELQNKIDRERIRNRYKLRELEIRQIRNLEEGLKNAEAEMAARDFSTGRIGGRSFASAQQAARAQARLNRGVDAVPFAGVGTIVKETFARNKLDAVNEFETGMADVALTVRDSLKDAIKSIASGAESFEDAMFNIFAALADKIATQGINQGVDSIFGSLFGKKHGGYIPHGYNQGGVVTGGSGVRDDVMTMMQGGEYVIKKSSAQKIGYGTLNAINSYANGGKARVSLAKGFLFNDPTNRPMSGGFNISRNLSMQGIFNENDPQTGEMFDKANRLDSYLNYRLQEQRRRDEIIRKAKQEKRGRLMNAYVSAGLRIGAGFIGNNFGPTAGGGAAGDAGGSSGLGGLPSADSSEFARGGSPALLMGGEYVMSPRTTAKYGTGFMGELNRGRVPGFNEGGMVGGGGGGMAAGVTTNNVSLNINVGNDGSTKVESQSQDSKSSNQERQDKEEVERSKQFGDAVRSAVLKEIQRQQRPGGLLRDGATYAGGKRI